MSFVATKYLKDSLAKRNGKMQAGLNINIARYYTDVDGAVIDKTAAPAALQVSLPVFLLGNFDRVGGYAVGQKTITWPGTAKFLCTYVHGYDPPFAWDSGFNTLAEFLNFGDIVTVFTDSLDAPTGFAFIVQTVQYGALASIISNTQTVQDDGQVGMMRVNGVSFQTDNASQVAEFWLIVRYDNLGLFVSEPFNPLQYKGPFHKLNDFIELDINFLLTQYKGISLLMLYDTNYMNVNFKIYRV